MEYGIFFEELFEMCILIDLMREGEGEGVRGDADPESKVYILNGCRLSTVTTVEMSTEL